MIVNDLSDFSNTIAGETDMEALTDLYYALAEENPELSFDVFLVTIEKKIHNQLQF